MAGIESWAVAHGGVLTLLEVVLATVTFLGWVGRIGFKWARIRVKSRGMNDDDIIRALRALSQVGVRDRWATPPELAINNLPIRVQAVVDRVGGGRAAQKRSAGHVVKLLAQGKSVLVEGPAGSGKSYLTRQLARNAGGRGWPASPPHFEDVPANSWKTPLLRRPDLARWAAGIIAQRHGALDRSGVERLIRSRRIILLVDGLDECRPQYGGTLIRAINAHCDSRPLLATIRSASSAVISDTTVASNTPLFDALAELHLEQFDKFSMCQVNNQDVTRSLRGHGVDNPEELPEHLLVTLSNPLSLEIFGWCWANLGRPPEFMELIAASPNALWIEYVCLIDQQRLEGTPQHALARFGVCLAAHSVTLGRIPFRDTFDFRTGPARWIGLVVYSVFITCSALLIPVKSATTLMPILLISLFYLPYILTRVGGIRRSTRSLVIRVIKVGVKATPIIVIGFVLFRYAVPFQTFTSDQTVMAASLCISIFSVGLVYGVSDFLFATLHPMFSALSRKWLTVNLVACSGINLLVWTATRQNPYLFALMPALSLATIMPLASQIASQWVASKVVGVSTSEWSRLRQMLVDAGAIRRFKDHYKVSHRLIEDAFLQCSTLPGVASKQLLRSTWSVVLDQPLNSPLTYTGSIGAKYFEQIRHMVRPRSELIGRIVVLVKDCLHRPSEMRGTLFWTSIVFLSSPVALRPFNVDRVWLQRQEIRLALGQQLRNRHRIETLFWGRYASIDEIGFAACLLDRLGCRIGWRAGTDLPPETEKEQFRALRAATLAIRSGQSADTESAERTLRSLARQGHFQGEAKSEIARAKLEDNEDAIAARDLLETMKGNHWLILTRQAQIEVASGEMDKARDLITQAYGHITLGNILWDYLEVLVTYDALLPGRGLMAEVQSAMPLGNYRLRNREGLRRILEDAGCVVEDAWFAPSETSNAVG